MARRRHTPEQVVRKLREADRLLNEGSDVAEVARHLEVSEQTYHRWRNQFGGMKADDVKRLKELDASEAHVLGSHICMFPQKSRRGLRATRGERVRVP